MSLNRSSLLRAATGAGVALAVSLGSASAAHAAQGWGYYLQIEDHIALPGEAQPDSVFVGYGTNSYPDLSLDLSKSPAVEVQRQGQVIASGLRSSDVRLADLRDGDDIVVRSRWESGNPELARYTYRKLPVLAGPVCAGAASYTGTRHAVGSTYSLYGQAVLWNPDPTKVGQPFTYGGYSGYDYPFSDAYYPGFYPGFGVKDSASLAVTRTAPDGFTAVPSKPLVAGMHVYLHEYLDIPTFAVNIDTDAIVQDCPSPSPVPTPGVTTPLPSLSPTPAPTNAPQQQPVARPTGDVTAPKGTLTGVTSRALRKVGRRKLVRTGLPVTITSSEAARLVGTLTLLGGKAPFVTQVSLPVVKGTTVTHVVLPNALRRQLAALKGKRARLRLEAALVDAAGNRQPLPPIAVQVPGR